ncbi:MAG: hypothetical protein ACI4U0_03740 [Candidatus Aphodocola sp.]
MQEIINSLGENTILIIFGVIVLVIVALFIILLIERKNKLNYLKEFEKIEEYEEKVPENIEVNNKTDEVENNSSVEGNQVIYEERINKTDAKKAIEEAAKKLVYEEQDIIGQTFFEKQQEENSIISYDELMSKNIDVDLENEKVLEDEGNEPITIDELYSMQKENESDEKIKEEKEALSENQTKEDEMIYYVNSESKKFKNSEVISPVFGIKRDVIYKKEYNELGETINIKELDMEIKKTEEFLKELKKLKSKLD